MSIKEMIEEKEKELKELHRIRDSIKATIYEFYEAITIKYGWQDHGKYLEWNDKAAKGFGKMKWYRLERPQSDPNIREFTRTVLMDAIEEVTGEASTSIEDLDIEEIHAVRSLVRNHLDGWLKRYWFI